MPLLADFRGITARAWHFYVFDEIQLNGAFLYASEAASFYRGARMWVRGDISLIPWEGQQLATGECDCEGIPGWWGVQEMCL